MGLFARDRAFGVAEGNGDRMSELLLDEVTDEIEVVATVELPPRRTVSPEHRAKMIEGKRLARERRERQEARKAERLARKEEAARQLADQVSPGVVERTPDAGPAPRPAPFSFPRVVPQEPPTGNIPRLVRMAEVGELIERHWPQILRWYPDARKEMVRPRLNVATRGVQDRLYRTDDGLALFELRQTPFEPLPTVATVFAIGRDIPAMLDAGLEWAAAIGAAAFRSDHPIIGTERAVWVRDLRERKALSSA